MAISAKQKAAQKAKERQQARIYLAAENQEKTCTCLVAIRGRGQHAIDCALYAE